MLQAAKRDSALVNDKWQKPGFSIEGVVTREVLHVSRDHGVITELCRSEWDTSGMPAVHAFDSPEIPYAWNRGAQARLHRDVGRS
ncbi:MAG TPA: hypothetical protein PLW68_06300 [Casimicrobiaceae bacterium]|nr:hypothetical protein [Casimicrobiaceae bacterium]